MNEFKPRIAITMGDPAGIGPEICAKALSNAQVREACEAILVGNAEIFRRTCESLGLFNEPCANDVRIVSVGDLDGFALGVDSNSTGKASAEYIQTAVKLWEEGEIDAIATAPISKKAISLAGYDYPGHTEFLAHLTGTTRVGMSFFGGDLRVVLLSTHLSLVNAIKKVTRSNLLELIQFSYNELGKLLGKRPKLAVAGLNPHASEGGMFGDEEMSEIEPAIKSAREHSIDVSGPYSPDTIFLRCYRGEFDAVIALYHDQATIPVKAFSFGSAVNVTLGLPLIRTSVDHGTAYDIAGKGIADPSSMISAIKLASELVRIKHR